MPKHKVSVSIDKDVSERADELAKEMGVSRSRLHEMAVEYYIERTNEDKLAAEFAMFYGNEPPSDEDRASLAGSSRTVADQLKDDEWQGKATSTGSAPTC